MTTARVEDADHERLVGLVEGRDVAPPHLPDIPRRHLKVHAVSAPVVSCIRV